jgi:hypothetical protein
VPDVEEETLEDSEREMFLQIDSLSFKEGNKWRVTDGGEPFYAVIEDMDFLNQIAKGDVLFQRMITFIASFANTKFVPAKGCSGKSVASSG